MQRKKSPPTFSQQELARAAEIRSANTGASIPRHGGCALNGWSCASAHTPQWDGAPGAAAGAKPPLAGGWHRTHRPHRAHIFLPPSPRSEYRLLLMNELPQSLLNSVPTRKRAWGLLMEKSLSLSALQCGYSYKENRIRAEYGEEEEKRRMTCRDQLARENKVLVVERHSWPSDQERNEAAVVCTGEAQHPGKELLQGHQGLAIV